MRAVVVRGIWILLSLTLAGTLACSSDDADGKGGSSGKGGNDSNTGGSGGSGGDDGTGGAGGGGGSPDVKCETAEDCPVEEPICDRGTCRAACTSHKECTAPDLPQCGENDCEPCTTSEACATKTGLLHCEEDSGQCVACLENEHCAIFASSPYCKEFKCVECTTGEQCPSGVCLPAGTCGPNPTCSETAPDCEGDRICHEDRGECLPSCNPELADQCQPGRGCEWLGNLADKTPFGACVPLVDGAGEQGDPCMSASECQPNLACLNSPEGSLCTGFCNTQTKDCPADFECIPASTPTGNTINVCSPIELPCEMNSDCEDGRVCTPVPVDGRLLCLPKVGTVQAGGLCKSSEECQSNLCLNDGTCYGPCRNDGDCPGLGGLCSTLTITYGRDSNNQPVQGKAPVCNIGCVTDDDCPGDRACGPAEAWGGELAGACVFKRQGTSRPGATCNTNSECSTGNCQGAPNGQAGRPAGQCFGTCGVSADCSGGAECVDRVFDDIDGSIHVCSGPLCKSEGDCATFRDYSCRFGYEMVGGEEAVRHRCLPPVGTAGALTSCTTGTQCRTGVCITWGPSSMSCYEACDTAADCNTGTCQSFNINITEGGVIVDTIALKGCRP